jgi:hypothetical protein
VNRGAWYFRRVLRVAFAAALLASSPSALAVEPWTPVDAALEAAYLTVHVADWMQTAQIAKWGGEWYETQPGGRWDRRPTEWNPVLGSTPSLARVNLYFGAGLVAHAAISWILPRPYRGYWQAASFTFQVGAVARNTASGVTMTMPW